MGQLDTSKNPWEVNLTSSNDKQTKTLYTNGTLLDRNIIVNVAGMTSGSYKVPTNLTALSSSSTSLSGTTLTVQASVTPEVVTAGYINGNGTAGTVKISGTVPTEAKTVTPSTAQQTINPTTGKLISSITVNATSADTAKSVLGNASLGNATSVPTGYTENTSVIVPSQGYLKINAGYIGNTVISLDQMLDGKADTAGTAANHILTGKIAYDVDGKKITGTIDTVTPSASTTASSASTSVTGMVTTTTNTGYSVSASATSGTASASAPAGYVASAASSSQSAKTASETKYIQKGILNAGVSGNITFTPSVSTNMTTISKPSTGTEGTDYYSITGSGSKSGTVSGTAGVTTEGYVKTETASGGSATGSIAANDKKYIAKSAVTTGSSAAPSSGNPINIAKDTNIKISAGYNPSDLYYKTQNYTIDDFATSGKYTASGSVTGANIKTYSSLDIAAAATPALAITDSSTAITPAAISGDTSKYNITTSVTGKTTYTTAGWIATTGLAATTDSSATVGTIVAGAVSNLSSDVTVPSGTTPTAVARGRKFKVSKGWYPDDLYYQAQGDAHSSFTPNTTYFQTGTSGAVNTNAVIPANQYTSTAQYLKAGTVTSGAPSLDSKSFVYDSTNSNFTLTTGIKVAAPTAGTAGWISSTEGTRNAYNLGNATNLTTSVAKIAGSVSISGTLTYKPSITRKTFAITGVTDASGGTAITTEPTTGVFVKVSSAANTGFISASASITTDGYGTSANHGISDSDNKTVGASASSATYIPIRTGTAGAVTGGRITGVDNTAINGCKVTLSSTNNGLSITRATAYYSITPGWISSTGAALSSSTQYIEGVRIASSNSGTRTFYIEVPNGSNNDFVRFTFKVGSDYNVWVE